MGVVVIRGTENGIVGGQNRGLISPVKINSEAVEDHRKYDEEEVHVDGEQQGEDDDRQGAHELVNVLICDHRNGVGLKNR